MDLSFVEVGVKKMTNIRFLLGFGLGVRSSLNGHVILGNLMHLMQPYHKHNDYTKIDSLKIHD